jgi:signal transduction histidine kinase
MKNALLNSPRLEPATAQRAQSMMSEHQIAIWVRTDRILSCVLIGQWLLTVVVAIVRSPLTWIGNESAVHPHVWMALLVGGAMLVAPVALSIYQPGRAITRHTIAVAMMLMSGLLIHLGGGQIELHFQIFGALAFLTFYRDWRVLITATVFTAGDHLFRGIFIPQSIYGIPHASFWLTAEHTAWVVFEDIFLCASCVMSVREMRSIAENHAMLEQSYLDVEKKVEQRTLELQRTQEDLVHSARLGGMGEMATSVLHNVGNVLNSVNISAGIIAEHSRESEAPTLLKVSSLLHEHESNLADFLTRDERGRHVPGFIAELAQCLADENQTILHEVENLERGIDHIKQVVAAQQSMAKTSMVCSMVVPSCLFETAMGLASRGQLKGVRVRREIAELPEMALDHHKVVQILINLINNAIQATSQLPPGERELVLSLGVVSTCEGERLRYQVRDNGVGIAPENLTRIFSYGFTTKKEGHGFGLQSAANAATEMGGWLSAQSDGIGRGATFNLDLPMAIALEEAA